MLPDPDLKRVGSRAGSRPQSDSLERVPSTSARHTQVHLRPSNSDEAEALVALQLAAFEALTRAAWGSWDPERIRAGMMADWREAETRSILAETGSPGGPELVGAVRLSHHADHDWLDLLVIATEHQGRGLGGAVLARLLDEAGERGVPLWLSVYRINPARRLYTRMGFSTHPRDAVRVLMGHPADAEPPQERRVAGPDRSV
jgi:GNAT superfamily N-acetyltransferase